MTKKDYVLIAEAFREARDKDGGFDTIMVIVNLMKGLQLDNPNFNREKFLDYINKKAV